MPLDVTYGWLTALLTLLQQATAQTFDVDYPVEEFRGVSAMLDFPVEEQDYPGIWIDFEPTQELETVGVDHREWTDVGDDGTVRGLRRWRFTGYATFTVVTLSSLERARLFDELVKVMAFGELSSGRRRFRQYIEDNEFLGCNFDFDQIGVQGKSEAPGTPWGSADVVYEITARMECVGEFVSDSTTESLVPLSAVRLYPYRPDEPDPATVSPLSNDPADWR